MPAHPTTVADFCAVLTRSKLRPEAEVSALQNRWANEFPGGETDVDGFRKSLVARRLLTEYQAALLQRGHADGYFIGDYVILDRLGKGASAGVYKAQHSSGQIVALKVLSRSKAKLPNVLNRFQREGRLLCQLDHPNVVQAFQLGQAGAIHFIVMELLDGETLDEVLARRKRLPVPEACRLIKQAFQGLQHLHERNMIHRDLKPSNLMVAPSAEDREKGVVHNPESTLTATLKILDVGIGRELFDDNSPLTQDLALTTEGAILGTPDYISPEQARDPRTADIRADIYSLGCVLFHLITGRLPFEEGSTINLMMKHAIDPLPRLSEVGLEVPALLQAVMDKLTAKKAADRFATPIEAAQALTPFLPTEHTTAVMPTVLPAYKKWLDSESGMEMEAPPEIMNKPTNPPSSPPPATQPPKSASGPRPSSSRSPSTKPSRPPRPAADEVPTINVELVTTPFARSDSGEDEEPRTMLDWDRRDFMMLGFGSGGMLLAMGLGYGLSKLLRSSTRETPGGPPAEAPGGPSAPS